MDIGQEVTKQGFPLDLLDKLMVCEVNVCFLKTPG